MMPGDLPTAFVAGVSKDGVGSRFGVKGSDSPALLQHLGFSIPTQPNRVTHWQPHEPLGSGRCLRQGGTEFLIELDTVTIASLPVNQDFPNAWALVRCDFSLVLEGAQWPVALAQLCSFDFTRLHDEPDLVVMTLLAGISVTLIREPSASKLDFSLRLWCDASFSVYLQHCLRSIGEST